VYPIYDPSNVFGTGFDFPSGHRHLREGGTAPAAMMGAAAALKVYQRHL
jgi:hypothetical protein